MVSIAIGGRIRRGSGSYDQFHGIRRPAMDLYAQSARQATSSSWRALTVLRDIEAGRSPVTASGGIS